MRQRARRDEDKAERVAAILTAAREVWSHATWSSFSADEVAKRAGIVKGTIYLYFPSKERLLLAVFECELEEVLDDIDRALGTRRARWSAGHVAEAFANAVRGRDALLRLLPIAEPLLDHNIDYRSALDFRRFAFERFMRTGSLIERRLRKVDDGMHAVRSMFVVLTGFAAMSFPSPVVQEVFRDEPALRALRADLHRDFLGAATALLHEMEKHS